MASWDLAWQSILIHSGRLSPTQRCPRSTSTVWVMLESRIKSEDELEPEKSSRGKRPLHPSRDTYLQMHSASEAGLETQAGL